MAIQDTESPRTTAQTIRVTQRDELRSALTDSSPPVLIHLNADTTWLLSLPYPPSTDRPSGRTRFNVLLDPWLQGPQSDVASWFSTQWHLVAPSVQTIEELNGVLAEAETGRRADAPAAYIDVVSISHEFTDHCHRATLEELPSKTPVFATEKAAELVRSWKHFDTVITTPGFSSSTPHWQKALSVSPLPSWVGIGRVITEGNALYYHSAVIIVFDMSGGLPSANESKPGAVIYSPHGVEASDLEIVKANGINTLALLAGLHDVKIWATKQLNLGALKSLEAVRTTGAKYWIATHDEVKKGGGILAPFLRRTKYTVSDAVKWETKSMGDKAPDYDFVDLGSGDGLVLV